ncbi:replication endonuclease [Citrobacter freundii]|nr:replication endonuclease [Citrobacter freundii]
MTASKSVSLAQQTAGGSKEAAGVCSWGAPKKAVNPYLDPADVKPGSALSNLITLYAADNEQEQLRREALCDEVWERYFFNESRDPVQREMEQDNLISRAKMAREQQRVNPDLVIIADVSAEASHISKPLLERIKYFHGLGRAKAYSRYLRETIRPCLERLARVRDSQVSASFRFMASHDGLEGLLVLPEMSQDQVKRLSTLIAAHMSMCLDAACGDLFVTDDVKPEEIRQAWERVAAEAMRLDVIPPAFEQLRRKRRRRKEVPYDLIPGSLARMLCADWWYRKLWQMRCEWREEQLRAVCLVNKKPSLFSAIKELFAGKQTSDDARFGDVHKAVGLVAEEHQNLFTKVGEQEKTITGFATQVKKLGEQLSATQDELATLRLELSTQDNNPERRKFATGGKPGASELTNC